MIDLVAPLDGATYAATCPERLPHHGMDPGQCHAARTTATGARYRGRSHGFRLVFTARATKPKLFSAP